MFTMSIVQINFFQITNKIKKLLANILVHLSDSPWSAPIVLAKKRTENFALCGLHETQFNNKEEHLSHSQDILLDQLGMAKFFTTLDLASRYCLSYYSASHNPLEVESGKEGKNDISTLIITFFQCFCGTPSVQQIFEFFLKILQGKNDITFKKVGDG